MRYFIETIDDEMVIGKQIAKWNAEDKINIIEKGDPIDEIRNDLIKIRKSFETLERLGINEEIMIAYIRTKGVSLKSIKDVLYHQERFFEKLGVK